jgi:hypothetical protein
MKLSLVTLHLPFIIFAASAMAVPIITKRLVSNPDQTDSSPSQMTPKLIFDIVFGLGISSAAFSLRSS